MPAPRMTTERRNYLLERTQAVIRATSEGTHVDTFTLGHITNAYRRSEELRNLFRQFDPETEQPENPRQPVEGGADVRQPFQAPAVVEESEPDEGELPVKPRTPVPHTEAERREEQAAERDAERKANEAATAGINKEPDVRSMPTAVPVQPQAAPPPGVRPAPPGSATATPAADPNEGRQGRVAPDAESFARPTKADEAKSGKGPKAR